MCPAGQGSATGGQGYMWLLTVLHVIELSVPFCHNDRQPSEFSVFIVKIQAFFQSIQQPLVYISFYIQQLETFRL